MNEKKRETEREKERAKMTDCMNESQTNVSARFKFTNPMSDQIAPPVALVPTGKQSLPSSDSPPAEPLPKRMDSL